MKMGISLSRETLEVMYVLFHFSYPCCLCLPSHWRPEIDSSDAKADTYA